jgi:mono/diheme cytochrome c family protein
MKREILFAGAVLAVAAAGFGVAFLVPGGGVADPNDPGQVTLGKWVYAENCAACHGANLEGQPDWQTRKPDDRLPAPPHDDSGHTWHHPDDVLFGITKHGVAKFVSPNYQSDMPAFDSVLSDDDIWAVLAYIKTHWSEANLQRQTMLSQRSRE